MAIAIEFHASHYSSRAVGAAPPCQLFHQWFAARTAVDGHKTS